MDYEEVLTAVLQNTQHTVESIAEILDLDVSELLDTGNKKRAIKLKLFADFLAEYGLYC